MIRYYNTVTLYTTSVRVAIILYSFNKIGGRVSSSRASANHVSALNSAPAGPRAHISSGAMPINCHHFAPRFTFALRMTRASSQNVGELYTEH